MAMQYQRGVVRLLLVWFVFWVGWCLFWYWQQDIGLKLVRETRTANPANTPWAEITYLMTQVGHAGDMLTLGLAMIFVVPLAAAAAGGAAYWVYRGFRPPASHSSDTGSLDG